MFIQRTIVEIFDNDLAKPLLADDILNKLSHDDYVLLRRNLRKRNKKGDPLYLCDECGTPLELSCTARQGSHEFFFRHFRDPDFNKCSIKTNVQRSEQEILRNQYAFKKESKPHIRLKECVSKVIRDYIDPDVIVDSKFINDRFGDQERRKPDIFFTHDGKELVIEFQVNNTFHSVIEEREAFYERNKISLFWVFGYFNPFEFQSITTKDIYVPNYNNAFVFDEDAESLSNEHETLYLKVFYKVYSVVGNEVVEAWMEEMIQLKDLSFDPQTHRPFYANCPELKQLAEIELEEMIKESRQQALDAVISQKAREFTDFLRNFKKNDLIHNNWLYYLTNYSAIELKKLNEKLNLQNYNKDGNDLFQQLLIQGSHSNLVQFLLKARQLEIYINVSGSETTLTTILKSSHIYKHDLVKSLFLRGYLLSGSDIAFIKQQEKGFESTRQITKYKYYEKVQTEGAIDLVVDNLNELFVIECAREGKIELLGNGIQGPVWLANLAITQYNKYWPIFDLAFKKFDFYSKILSQDTKGSFKKKLAQNPNPHGFLESYPFFESVVKTLFPELREDSKYPSIIV
jgi:hypothetical protein